MTVIAYKDGILAADTAGWMRDMIVEDTCKVKTNDRFCWASCGETVRIQQFDAWANDYFNPDSPLKPEKNDRDDFGAIIVDRDGRVFRCTNLFVLREVTGFGLIVVEGSSSEFMTGALMAGASAPQAVKMAIEVCAWAGGRCVWVDTKTGLFHP